MTAEHGIDLVLPKLAARVAALVRQHHLPGAAVGVVRDQELAWSAGFGFADIAARRGPDQRTLYRVASITKTVTATAIMQLRDNGQLALDEPISRYLPEFAAVRTRHGSADDATIRRLLSHRSGLITEGPFAYWDSRDFPTMVEILAALPETELVIAPDSAMKYSNLAYALLGEVVTRLSGRPYEEYVRTEIFEPLGMCGSTFAPEGELAARLATGYDPHPFEDMPEPAGHTPTRGITAAAGLYTCVEDLARWIALQFRTNSAGEPEAASTTGGESGTVRTPEVQQHGTQIVAGATLAEMHRPQDIDPTWSSARCLGWMAQRRGERVYHGHGGSIHGFITQVLFSTSCKAGVIVLTNEGRHAAASQIALEALDLIVDAVDAALPVPEWEPPIAVPEAWRSLLGRYEFWRGGLVHLEARNGRLHLALPPGVESSLHAPATLEPTDTPHVFRVAGGRGAGELLTFAYDDAGEAAGFVLAGFAYQRLRGRRDPATDRQGGERWR